MLFLRALPDGVDMDVLAPFDPARVEQYFLFLQQKNPEGGFFSEADSARIADRHVFESMAYVRRIMSLPGVSRETSFLDVGAGPGLPGYLFACLKKPPYVTLLDSSRRRLSLLEAFYRESWEREGVSPRVSFKYIRAEEFRGSYDIVLARALIPFPFNAILVRHLFRFRIALAAGPSPASASALSTLQRYGLELSEESCRLPELNFLGERNLLLVRKAGSASSLPAVAWKKIKGEMDEWRKSSQ